MRKIDCLHNIFYLCIHFNLRWERISNYHCSRLLSSAGIMIGVINQLMMMMVSHIHKMKAIDKFCTNFVTSEYSSLLLLSYYYVLLGRIYDHCTTYSRIGWWKKRKKNGFLLSSAAKCEVKKVPPKDCHQLTKTTLPFQIAILIAPFSWLIDRDSFEDR